MRWKDEQLAIADTTGLQYALDLKAPLSLVRTELITLTEDGRFLMLAGYKLTAVALKNNSGADMTVALNNNPGNIVNNYEFDLPSGAEVDFEIGKTYWSETTIYVSGIVGELILRIDRK